MTNVAILEDGRAAVFGQFLRDLLAIHEHHKLGGERLVGLAGDRFPGRVAYEATVLRQPHSFDLELEVKDGKVVELSRKAA